MNINKSLIIYIVVALAGLLDSFYLTYTRFAGITPPCTVSFISGCATVAKSKYSVLLGVPLSVFGMFFYGFAILISAIYIWKKFNYFKELLLAVSVLGTISSIYFLYLQAFVIKAFCIYCLASAIFSFILLAISIYVYKK